MVFEKLCIRTLPGWFVWAYKPRRTKKGHYIWVKSHVLAGPFDTKESASNEYPEAKTYGSLHGAKLTDNEVIKVIAEEKP